MDDKEKPKSKTNTEPQFIEEEITYTRRRRVYTYACSLTDCPYCNNNRTFA